MPENCEYAGGGSGGSATRVCSYLPDGPGLDAGVLIVPSIGDERRSLVRVEVELARRLASEGYSVIRFDPAGDPDSPVPAEERSVEYLSSDIDNAISVTAVPPVLYAVGMRAGAHCLEFHLPVSMKGVILLAPVTGEEYVRDLLRRRSLRKMLTGGDGAKQDDGRAGMVDIDGCVYPQRFLDAFAGDAAPAGKGRLAALQIGPARRPVSSTCSALRPWLKGGFEGSLPSELPDGLSVPGPDPLAVWRHPVLWGRTEHADITPLAEFVMAVLAHWRKDGDSPAATGDCR